MLNLFFVIVCKLDVAGVAIATVISQCISASLVLRCMVKDTGPLHLDLKKMRLHPQPCGRSSASACPPDSRGFSSPCPTW